MTRTITTEAELDALPTGTVVLSHNYPNGPHTDTHAAFQKRADSNWYRGARASFVHPNELLPATLLHQPGKPALPHRDELAEAIYNDRVHRGRSPDNWADLDDLDRKVWRIYADAALKRIKGENQ